MSASGAASPFQRFAYIDSENNLRETISNGSVSKTGHTVVGLESQFRELDNRGVKLRTIVFLSIPRLVHYLQRNTYMHDNDIIVMILAV